LRGTGCKPLPKPGTTGKCALNGAWKINNKNHTITALMDGQCLQLTAESLSTAPCRSSGTQPPPPPPHPKGPGYVRLPQKESCPSGTALSTKAECVAAFAALRSSLPVGAKDNSKCCRGDNLPYGCTYRTDNDFVFNDNAASPASYSAGGWRAVCSTGPPQGQEVTQEFVVTVLKDAAAGDEVTIQAMGTNESETNSGTLLCIDNDAQP
jgi:hypothetical protein